MEGVTDDLRLPTADNLRDVAGPGYRAADGTPLRPGVFFRSNRLTLGDDDLAVVSTLGLTAIHDLRRHDEVEQHPDVEVPGASWHHHDVLGVAADDAARFTDPAQTRALMEQAYRDFVTSPRSREALGSLLLHLAAGEGPQLFHCTSGKDRAGWAAYVVLAVAGVDEGTRRADYLLSNERTRGSRAVFEERIAEALGPEAVPVISPALEVREAYLDLSLALVEEEYGDLGGYLARGLGVPEDARAAIRARLLG